MSDAVAVALITAIAQTIGLVVVHIANKRSRRKATKVITERLDANAIAHVATVAACNDVVKALTTQVTRLQDRASKRDVVEHDDQAPRL